MVFPRSNNLHDVYRHGSKLPLHFFFSCDEKKAGRFQCRRRQVGWSLQGGGWLPKNGGLVQMPFRMKSWWIFVVKSWLRSFSRGVIQVESAVAMFRWIMCFFGGECRITFKSGRSGKRSITILRSDSYCNSLHDPLLECLDRTQVYIMNICVYKYMFIPRQHIFSYIHICTFTNYIKRS